MKLIEEKVKVHDQFQFELKLSYGFNGQFESISDDVEMYLFLPRNLCINAQTYSKEAFYSDLMTHLRIKTPSFLLRDITTGEDSPLARLTAGIRTYLKAQNDTHARLDLEHRIKMFCCITKSALREHAAFVPRQKNPADVARLLAEFLEHARAVAEKYRALRALVNEPGLDSDVIASYLFGDEYLSLVIEKYAYVLLERVQAMKVPVDQAFREECFRLVREEVAYRVREGYPSIPREKSANEVYLFRKSVLKKFAHSALFLDTQREREGVLLEQVLFGVAAGAAMFFATAVAFLSQMWYEALTAPFFVILVLSYMFKDRIKELLRQYFSQKMRRWLFDHKTSIYVDARNPIGFSRETFDFLKSGMLPEAVEKLRDMDRITEFENDFLGENVIRYHKHVRLFPPRLRSLFQAWSVTGVNDIVRFNVSKLLYRMDNPRQGLNVLGESGITRVPGQRVYHLNLVLRLSAANGHPVYRRYRVVLTRNGIKRIETVGEL